MTALSFASTAFTPNVVTSKSVNDRDDAPLDTSVRALIVRKMLLNDSSVVLAKAPETSEPIPAQTIALRLQQGESLSVSRDTVTLSHQSLQLSREQLAVQQSVQLSTGATAVSQRLQTSTQTSSQQLSVSQGAIQKQDPLMLDLNGDGLTLTGIEQGVSFDLDADGQSETVSFASGGDAFLALDRNQNGQIDDGTELFGDQNGAEHGFAELAKLDANQDGRIDAEDPVFDKLRLISVQDGQLVQRTLAEAGVRSFSLDYQNTRQALNRYDEVAQLGHFQFEDGRDAILADVLVASKKL